MYLQLAHDERDKPCICPPVTRITAGIYQSTQARGAYSAPSDPLLVESGASCPLPKTPPLLGAYRVLPRPPSWWRGGWLTLSKNHILLSRHSGLASPAPLQN